jgi:hypothetical protein
MAAEASINSAISSINAIANRKQKFVLSAQDITNQFVTLSYLAVSNSVIVTVNRLSAHQDEDYTVSVAGGVTKLTFAGSLATSGLEELTEGDVLFVKYLS